MHTTIIHSNIHPNENRQSKFAEALTQTKNKERVSACSSVKKCTLAMDVLTKDNLNRTEVEHFIAEGFAKTYQAKISITTPWLLTVKDLKYKAALGIRSATSPLFIEQYIDKPIEQAIAKNRPQRCFNGHQINAITRDKIAEIGHLYSNGKRFTLPLLLVTAVSLFCNDYQYMVFSGTEQVLNLIAKTGVNCLFIADAKPEKLCNSEDNWGSYYETDPKVVAISLLEVMTLINHHPLYAPMFANLNKKIAKTTASLRVSK